MRKQGVLCLAMGAATFVAAAAGAVEYRLGPATELLDAAFYAGQVVDGSDVLGRMAFFPRSSNDGLTVAFWAVNAATFQTAIFLVDFGDPSSWRRLTPDASHAPDAPIYWTPDDQYLVAGNARIPVATGVLEIPTYNGFGLNDTSTTRLPADNWFVTHAAGEMVLLPVMPDGQPDSSRQAVIVTDFAAAGVDVDWPAVAPDGSAATFADYHGSQPPGQADLADVYVLTNLQAIASAPKRPGTDISTLAPTSLADPSIIAIRAAETADFAHTPQFSEDKSLVLFTEDWNNVFRDDNFFGTLFLGDWDIMISSADGSGADYRVVAPENQSGASPTPGGTRMLYNKELAGYVHIFASTLEVATQLTGTPVGDPADNDILTTVEQQVSDASRTVVEIPTATTIDFPVGVPQEIEILTPIDPVTEPQLPSGIDAIPVIRQFGPEGTTFSQPITVTISYTDAEVEGLDEPNLRVFLYNQATGVYDIEVTTIVSRDLNGNTISFTVDHFSIYGLGGSVKQTPAAGVAGVCALLGLVIAVGVRRIRSPRG